MIKLFRLLKIIFFLIFVLTGIESKAQTDSLSSDELYTLARNAAFEEDNYPKAVSLLKRAIDQSPDYLEIQVFLGRIYTYSDSLSLARNTFRQVLEKDATREDASFAYGNLEYWNDQPQEALVIVDSGIEYNPGSEDLILLKAKILKDLKEYEAAALTLQNLLAQNPKLTQARSLLRALNTAAAKNSVGVTYEYVYFDKRFDAPWHLAGIDYTRQTALGSVSGRLNYANRFRNDAIQAEIEAYPRISDLFYTYVNFGVSNDSGIFPKLRGGFSLFANLPAAFEADAGFRYLSFDDDTFIYTVGVGKYYKNYWFNLRTYLTPTSGELSKSLSLTVRYYLGGADDFLGIRTGVGISPDNSANSVLFDGTGQNRLRSNNIFLTYRKLFSGTNVLIFETGIEDQEYAVDTRGIQFSASLGYIKRF
ncbi:YaiO family outer membrane beta-barrel protein [Leeuwenhoekiella nanhaiensis]|uniref:YaiO beta-barrel domain-containing protein n=1 Tax=Leeuwenhoekiella nanhaiensis TaxID=1655491 RepID=A0A2G1VPS4_9FLAO|nr:YaiO family outer membrane beta-barrel protein [Leeuwenhoekiella nanhaiensis]PHQ28765.1 hypothetical protein CJ305_13175 [Leeuwenhoekiella nanhaiensis]